MARTILIYAREDADEAQDLAWRLERDAYPVEIRMSLGFGASAFADSIPSLIQGASGVLVLWSPRSLRNDSILSYARLASEKGNLVSVLSRSLPFLPVVEGKPRTSRLEFYGILESKAASLFPPWLSEDHVPEEELSKQKPSLRSAIDKVMLDSETEASNWDSPEVVAAFHRARGNSNKELGRRRTGGEEGSWVDHALFVLPGVIIVGSVIWGISRDALSLELVGWAALSAFLVNLLRGLRR